MQDMNGGFNEIAVQTYIDNVVRVLKTMDILEYTRISHVSPIIEYSELFACLQRVLHDCFFRSILRVSRK